MSHSPLPWYPGSEHADERLTVWSNQVVVCECNLNPDDVPMIVRAVSHHAKLVGALTWLLDDMTDAGEDANPETGTTYDSVAHAREALAAAQGEQPEKLVFQLAKPAESEAIKLLAWFIRQFEGTSGAGVNHWQQYPEFVRARELTGQPLTDRASAIDLLREIVDDADDTGCDGVTVVDKGVISRAEDYLAGFPLDADGEPVSDPNKLPELPNGELKCTCGHDEFRYVEDIGCWREVTAINEGVLFVDGLYKTEGYDDGENPRLQCSRCCAEYAIPEDVETEFE
jgi:hypothetical protein